MAIQYTYESESGTTGSFWQINDFSISARAKLCFFTVECFKDVDAFKCAKTPVSSRHYSLFGPLYPFTAGAFDSLPSGSSPADLIYSILLTQFSGDWVGATIVTEEDYGSDL